MTSEFLSPIGILRFALAFNSSQAASNSRVANAYLVTTVQTIPPPNSRGLIISILSCILRVLIHLIGTVRLLQRLNQFTTD